MGKIQLAQYPVILFDREVSKNVKKTAAELYGQMPVGEEDDSIPTELKILARKKYAFQITISNTTLRNRRPRFTVSKMTEAKAGMDKLVGGSVPHDGPPNKVDGEEIEVLNAENSNIGHKKHDNDEAGLSENLSAESAKKMLTPKVEKN